MKHKKGGQANLSLDRYFKIFKNVYNLTEHSIPGQNKIINDLSIFFATCLGNVKYCSEMSKSEWTEFINIYSSNYLKFICSSNPNANQTTFIDPNIAARCLRRLITNSAKYIGVFSTVKLFAFFNLSVLHIK